MTISDLMQHLRLQPALPLTPANHRVRGLMKVGDPITRLIAPMIGNREMKEKDKVGQKDQLH